MVDALHGHLEAELRRRVSRLLADDAAWKTPRAELLSRLAQSDKQAFLFGGAVRDLMLWSPYHAFRDIDVVVDGATTDTLQVEFGPHVVRRTRFGGLHLDVEGWLFDLWPLADTWAFREYPTLLRPRPEELPSTTFMTVEAVVVSLSSKPGHPRQVFESGFFEALVTRTIELNFEHNPYPKLNAVRTLLTASRLGFAIGPRLVRFLSDQVRRSEMEELVEVQRRHYGRVLLDEETLSQRFYEVENWLRWNPERSMPVRSQSQLLFHGFDKKADFAMQLPQDMSGRR